MKQPETIVCELIIAQLFPHQRYEIPRSVITPLGGENSQKMISITPSIYLDGKKIIVVISLIREKIDKQGLWRDGCVTTDYGVYDVVFDGDHPLVVPS